MHRQTIAVGAILAAIATCPALASPPSYSITPIFVSDHPATPITTTINDAATVAIWGGPFTSEPADKAFLWSNGTFTHIPTAPGHAVVFGTNGSGVAVGSVMNDYVLSSFIWDPASGVLTVPTLDGLPIDSITAINDHGQAGGWALDPVTGHARPILWDAATGSSLLPSIGTGDSAVRAINNVGQAVGSVGDDIFDAFPSNLDSPLGQSHAVLWQNGSLTDLTPGFQWSGASDINDRGQVVGWYWTAEYINYPDGVAVMLPQTPYLWDPVRGLIPLPDLPNSKATAAALNEAGQIVGGAFLADQTWHALLWTDEHTLYDLNDLLPDTGWTFNEATGINNLGQIVGTGTYLGQPAAFLLTPTALPEPAILALIPLLLLVPCRPRRCSTLPLPGQSEVSLP